MGDGVKKFVGWACIIGTIGLALMAISANMEEGPPAYSRSDVEPHSPAPDGRGCVPVCMSIIGVLSIFITRLGCIILR